MVYIKEITPAEMNVVLTLVKSPEVVYNANSLSKVIGITSMGTLKILKRLEQEQIVKSRKIGKAVTYKVNVEDPYARKYLSLIFGREAQCANTLVKRWINELRKITKADVIFLFGSVLEKMNPNDIDALFVTDQKRFPKLQQEIKELNELNIKKIHPLFQTYEDIIKNIRKKDKPLLNAIKGILIFGEDQFMEIYNESRKE
ncbi:hypothetical protein HYT52_03310 [Candidatus Woesearchaeota archaeon]|nr:hypothetical protein [Candidatus Woesearchaeota archaeon]